MSHIAVPGDLPAVPHGTDAVMITLEANESPTTDLKVVDEREVPVLTEYTLMALVRWNISRNLFNKLLGNVDRKCRTPAQ